MEPQNQTTPTQPVQPISPIEIPKPKNNNLLIILLLALLLLAISATVFFALQTQKLSKELAQLQVQVQTTPTPTASQAPNGDLANWKTYTSVNYSFKYPADWTASKDVGLFNDPTMKFILDLQAKDTTLSTQDWANANVCTKFATPTDPNGCTTYASGPINNSIQFTFLAHYGAMHTVFKNGNTIFDVTVNAREPNPNFEDIKGVYDQILSSFKFLNTNNPLGQYCAGPNNLPCPAGYACKLNVIGDIASGGKCVNESETNP